MLYTVRMSILHDIGNINIVSKQCMCIGIFIPAGTNLAE